MAKYPKQPKRSHDTNDDGVERVLAAYERFHAWLTKAHVPDFLELNLTLAQMRALYLVAAAGPMTMAEVAERLGTVPSSTTAVIDALVRLGLVERIEDPADRRRVRVATTPAARERLEDLSELGRGRLRSLLSAIHDPADLVTIERAIDLLAEAGRALPEEPT